MSMFIKGMQMPSNCMKCPMLNDSGDCCVLSHKQNYAYDDMEQVKDNYCPLIEIPENHGDFFDKQKLLRDLANMWYDGDTTITGVSVSELIRQQETIIESEE